MCKKEIQTVVSEMHRSGFIHVQPCLLAALYLQQLRWVVTFSLAFPWKSLLTWYLVSESQALLWEHESVPFNFQTSCFL